MGMKKNNHIFRFLLFFFLIPIIVGCRRGGEFQVYEDLLQDGEPIYLNIWAVFRNKEHMAFNNIISQFNRTVGRTKNITIVNRFFQNNEALIQEIIRSSEKEMGALELPHIILADPDDIFAIDSKYQNIAALDNFFSKKELEEFISEALVPGRYDNDQSLKMIPFGLTMDLTYLNQTDWQTYIEQYPHTMDELKHTDSFFEIAKEYYEYSNGKAFFGTKKYYTTVSFYFHAAEQEIVSINPITKQATLMLDRNLMKEIYDFLYKNYAKGFFSAQEIYHSNSMKFGEVLSYTTDLSGVSYIPEKVYLSDYNSYDIVANVLSVPECSKDNTKTFLYGPGFSVLKSNTRNEYASAVVIKYLTSNQRNSRIAVMLRQLPVKKELLNFDLLQEIILQEYRQENRIFVSPNQYPITKQQMENSITAYRVILDRLTSSKIMLSSPFHNSKEFRKIIDSAFFGNKILGMEQIKNASELKEEIRHAMASGISEEEIEQRLEVNFEPWYESLVSYLAIVLERNRDQLNEER